MGAMNIFYYYLQLHQIAKNVKAEEDEIGSETDFNAHPLTPFLDEYKRGADGERILVESDVCLSAAFYRKNHRIDIDKELPCPKEREKSTDFPSLSST